MKTRTFLTSLALSLSAATLPLANAAINPGDIFYIDFGKNDVNNGIIMPGEGSMDINAGNSTGVADSYGIYWNNAWTNTAVAGGPTPPEAVMNLITSTNVVTSVFLTFSKGWESNGFENGGLTNPNPALLGNFASKNATGDYFFINKPYTEGQQGIASMTFYDLDPTLTYNFKMFGTRAENEVRKTEYSITDINGTHQFLLQTSGAGVGAGGANGNNDTFAYLTGIVPDETGSITLTVRVAESNFGYIGAMELTAVPEPSTTLLLLAAGSGAWIVYRRRRQSGQNA